MKILFTCGGTAGHINPAVALARMFQQRHPGCEILFVGADGGMETRLVPKEGYPIRTVTISSFYRSLNLNSLKHNLKTLRNLNRSKQQARVILDEFRPDLVVGTGGYASFPVVNAAAKRGIPTAIHESNALPGLTTKALAKVVDVVMVGFEESRQHYANPEKVMVTGTPVRGDFFRLTREEARAELGLTDDLPLVVSVWGSLGAAAMNRQMVDFLKLSVGQNAPFHHIHGAGRNYNTVLTSLTEAGIDLKNHPRIDLREYIYDMPTVMAAADVVLCRAGASTIAEVTALGKPAILVPSPNVTADHQTKNARVLEQAGGAILLPEAQCTPETLHRQVSDLLADGAKRARMAQALSKLSRLDANERIFDTLSALLP